MQPNLALYRRYRPETFAEVIGQDHVTVPLRNALAADRTNHAYLFSGPRGCGKTTSARILARALNCEQAPIAEPCGECQSCQDLARGGPGSVDVIEIDAASHGGVDDARDLREKAFFAPVSSRYKIYIIDEAHMVSPQGFNALLKLVEEPPDHLKFVFATTEPEKVLPTIRSRTHHYPFRLIPPRILADYLAELCEMESVPIEPAALPLVVRAGGGSARDTLSVLDQLLGAAGPEGVTHQLASGLLGYTPEALLDEVVDAFAAADNASVFAVIDRVIEAGQDPRRFAEDLLRRFRDLIVLAADPDAVTSGLLDVPSDRAERLAGQATRFGKADLVRAADCVATGLTEMRGATAPRLLLELICARILLPAVDHDAEGLAARVDRLERRIGMGGGAAEVPAQSEERVRKRDQAAARAVQDAAKPEAPRPEAAKPDAAKPEAAQSVPQGEPTPARAAGSVGLSDLRRVWPDVMDRLKTIRRFAWMVVSQEAQVVGLEGDVVTLGFRKPEARESFLRSDLNVEGVQRAFADELGADYQIQAVVAGEEPKPAAAAAEPTAAESHPDAGDAHPDDPEMTESDGADLLAEALGATVIDEIPHD